MEASFKEGDTVNNRYVIIKIMESGEMGTTYLAKERYTGNNVILKVISLTQVSEWKKLDFFKREAALLRKIDHPLIPDYLDYFEINKDKDNLSVLVQEYIEGETLWEAVKQKKRFTTNDIISIFKSLLTILDYIHNLNPLVIHRDVNPKNIILGKDKKIYLVNFGAARVTEDKKADGNTIVVKIGYSAQEQLYGRSAPGSDLYSLAVTIIFLLTAREPSHFQLKNMKLDYHPFVDISGKLKVILDLMIEPELENRIQDAKTILEYLKEKKEAVTYINKKSKELKIRLEEPPKDYLKIFRRREKWQKTKTIFLSGILLVILFFLDIPLKKIYIKELYLFFSLFLIFLKIIGFILIWNIVKNFFFIELEITNDVKKKNVFIKALIIFISGLIVNFLDMAIFIPLYVYIIFSSLGAIVICGKKKIKQIILLIIFVPIFSWLGISLMHFSVWLLLSFFIVLFMCRDMEKWFAIIPAAAFVIIIFTHITAYYMAVESDNIKSEPETIVLFTLPYTLGADVNFRLDTTILCALSRSNKVKVAEYLVNRGAKIEFKDIRGETPLHRAAWRGNTRMFEFLLSKGADTNSVNYYGETPLVIAAGNGDISGLELLIANGADMTIGTPLHSAVEYNRPEAVAYLIEHGADINKTDEAGNTPLHHAVRIKEKIDIVQLLLEKGALPEIKSFDHKTPLDLALEYKNNAAVELLKKHKNR